jgi:hypothetical protein
LPDIHDIPDLEKDLLDDTGLGGWHLEHGFFRLEFQKRVAF